MKKLLLILALAASAAQAADAEDGWMNITSSPSLGFSVDFKQHGCHKGTNVHDVHYESCTARFNSYGTISFRLVSVDVSECVQGFGTLWEMDLNGEVLEKYQVVANGGSNSATEFDTLCGLATPST